MNYLFCFHGYYRSKKLKFSFVKKEYPFACATVQFDWIFLNSARYKNALITPSIKNFAHFVARCLFDVSQIVFLLNNHQVTLQFTQKLVSELF